MIVRMVKVKKKSKYNLPALRCKTPSGSVDFTMPNIVGKLLFEEKKAIEFIFVIVVVVVYYPNKI